MERVLVVLALGAAASAIAVEPRAKYDGPVYVPKINEFGVPEDTPEVKAAKAEHIAALVKAHAEGVNNVDDEDQEQDDGRYHQGGKQYTVAKYLPPPQRKGNVWVENYQLPAYKPRVSTPLVPPPPPPPVPPRTAYDDGRDGDAISYQSPAAVGYGKYNGPIHVPVLTKNGVPLDTPEVQRAKEEHLKALQAANGFFTSDPARINYESNEVQTQYQRPRYDPSPVQFPAVPPGDGVLPQDTPEVYAAKQQHLAALARAAQRERYRQPGQYQPPPPPPRPFPVAVKYSQDYRDPDFYRPKPFPVIVEKPRSYPVDVVRAPDSGATAKSYWRANFGPYDGRSIGPGPNEAGFRYYVVHDERPKRYY